MVAILASSLAICAEPVSNPILKSAPDPYLAVHNGLYYLTYTTGRDIRVRRASTLSGLAQAEAVQVWIDSEPTRCCNVWAPEFHRLPTATGYRWYLYYAA